MTVAKYNSVHVFALGWQFYRKTVLHPFHDSTIVHLYHRDTIYSNWFKINLRKEAGKPESRAIPRHLTRNRPTPWLCTESESIWCPWSISRENNKCLQLYRSIISHNNQKQQQQNGKNKRKVLPPPAAARQRANTRRRVLESITKANFHLRSLWTR